MKILQELAQRCTCPVCQPGCLCGDCRACSNAALDRAMVRNAKTISALACLFVVFGGFIFFVPVVSLAATPTITQTVSLRVPSAENATTPMGSISFCLFGDGAVLVHGSYYPSVAMNQTGRHFCGRNQT